MPIINPNNLPKEITSKYSIVSNAFKFDKVVNAELDIYKNEPKDEITTEIGDTKQTEFHPQIKIQRWNNEVNCSIRLVTDEKTPVVSTEVDKIKWVGDKTEAHFYPITEGEGGYEFEVILREKPASNVIEFTLQTKGLDFFYQPPLTEEYKVGDNYWRGTIITEVTETDVIGENGKVLVHRPENIVGSYAIYHQTKGGLNDINGKDYRAGQAGFIYRPKIKDALGEEVWADLNIDVGQGLMTITVPQDFLDKATYPVAIDPNYGYETVAGTWAEYLSCTVESFVAELGNAPANGTLNYLHWALYCIDNEVTAKTAFYGDTSGKPKTRLGLDTNHFHVTDTSSPGSFFTSSDNYNLALASGTPYCKN